MLSIDSAACSVCPLGALLVAVLLLGVSTVPCQTVDVTPGLADMKDGDKNVTLGRITETEELKPGGMIYLPTGVPYDCVIYKIEAYFITQDPVYIQVWGKDGGGKGGSNMEYKLKYQKKIQADKPNTIQSFYTMKKHTDGSLYCPEMHNDYKIGVFSPANNIPIPVYYDSSRPDRLAKSYTSTLQIDDKKKFDMISFPYQFSLKIYLYKGGLISGSSFGHCPAEIIAMETATTTTETVTTSADVNGHTEGITANSSSGGQNQPGNQKVWPVVAGALAGVVIVAIIIGVAVYCRRRSQKTPSKNSQTTQDKTPQKDKRQKKISNQKENRGQPKEKKQGKNKNQKQPIPGDGDYLEPVSTNNSAPSTVNPAYGIKFDFMNTYESPTPVSRPEAPHTYVPIIPPRPAGDPGHGTITPSGATSNPGHGTKSAAYEEINNDEKPRPKLKPPVKPTNTDTKSGPYEEIKNDEKPRMMPKPPVKPVKPSTDVTRNNKGWKLPGMAPNTRRLDPDSGLYEDVDTRGAHTYLELMPDDASRDMK